MLLCVSAYIFFAKSHHRHCDCLFVADIGPLGFTSIKQNKFSHGLLSSPFLYNRHRNFSLFFSDSFVAREPAVASDTGDNGNVYKTGLVHRN